MSTASSNPPLPPLSLASWKILLMAESIALGMVIWWGLGSEIGLPAATWLSIAVLTWGVQVASPALAPDTRMRWDSWIPVGFFVVATVLFMASINHRPHIVVHEAPTPVAPRRRCG